MIHWFRQRETREGKKDPGPRAHPKASPDPLARRAGRQIARQVAHPLRDCLGVACIEAVWVAGPPVGLPSPLGLPIGVPVSPVGGSLPLLLLSTRARRCSAGHERETACGGC